MGLVQSHGFKHQEKITVDGLRIQFKHGWALVRASNTTPCLTLRFEAETEAHLNQIQDQVMNELHRIIPNLTAN